MNALQYKNYLTPRNIAVALLVIVVTVVVILSILTRKEEQAPSPSAEAPAPLAEKQPDCLYTHGKGKQTYTIMRDNPDDFEITRIDVDPIDVQEGQTQTLRVTVKDKDKNATTEGTVISTNIFTDKKNTAAAAFTLFNQERDPKDKSSLLSTWESSWTRNGVICRTYMETITAKNANGGEAKVDLSFK